MSLAGRYVVLMPNNPRGGGVSAASGAVVSNFRRVELFGYPELGWVRGTVDTEEPEVFRFEPRPWRRGGGAP